VTVTIRYLSLLRDRTGVREEAFRGEEGIRLRDVARYLRERYGFSPDDRTIMFTLNGKGWSQHPAGLDTPLEEGDRVLLFPPVSGG
jgi:MoaD family protein